MLPHIFFLHLLLFFEELQTTWVAASSLIVEIPLSYFYSVINEHPHREMRSPPLNNHVSILQAMPHFHTGPNNYIHG